MHKEFQGGGGLRVPKILYALVLCVFYLLLIQNSRKDPRNSHSLLEFSDSFTESNSKVGLWVHVTI